MQRYRPHSDCREIPNLGMQHGSYLKQDDTGPAVLYSDAVAREAALQERVRILEIELRKYVPGEQFCKCETCVNSRAVLAESALREDEP